VERAAAVLFHRVYQEAFLRDHRASRLVFPRRGWGTLLERLAAYFETRGGVVRRGARAEALVLEAGRARGVRLAQRPSQREEIVVGAAAEERVEPADAVVSALPPPALLALLSEDLRSAPRSRDSRSSADRRSSRSTSGSTAWSSTGRCSACATPRWSGCSTRDGSMDARERRSTWPSSRARPTAARPSRTPSWWPPPSGR
jgi:phytoene dehydrogenase-like protein